MDSNKRYVHAYYYYARDFMQQYLKQMRIEMHLTQEQMAYLLRMSIRTYRDLERAENALSTPVFLFLLSIMPDETILHMVEEFRKSVAYADERNLVDWE